MAEPESIDINELASRIEALDKEPAGVGETPEVDREHAAEQAEQARVGNDAQRGERHDAEDNSVHEGEDAPDAAESGEEDAGPEVAGEEAPEFWSAEDKEFWNKNIPPEARPLIKKYEAARIEFANSKAQEAAAARQAAEEKASKALSTVDQAASWWEQNAQQFVKAFGDKWSTVNWDDLAANNPAEWARLKQARDNEAALLTQANERGQRDIAERNARQEQAFEQERVTEHQKVAKKLPKYFGTTEQATATYRGIGEYLHSYGIPAERIRTIYEAPIIEIALKAKLYDEAQKQTSAATSSGAAKNPATPAPTRVAPGPAARPGNRSSDAARQAKQRFMQNNNDMDAAAEYLRATGLA